MDMSLCKYMRVYENLYGLENCRRDFLITNFIKIHPLVVQLKYTPTHIRTDTEALQ